MIHPVQNRNLWVAFAVWGSFWLFAPFMDTSDLFDLVNGLGVAIGVGVIFAYAPGAYRSLRLPPDRMLAGHYLVLGILTAVAGFVAHRFWGWIWRWVDKPTWMLDHKVLAWFFWIIASGYVVHLTSVNAIEGRVPGKNWVRLGIYVAAGLVLAAVAITFIGP